jgi:hypothetical protein
MEGNVVVEHKSEYGREVVFKHGKEYTYIKIVEYVYNGDFLVMIKSVKDGKGLLVNIQEDKDFVVKFFNN